MDFESIILKKLKSRNQRETESMQGTLNYSNIHSVQALKTRITMLSEQNRNLKASLRAPIPVADKSETYSTAKDSYVSVSSLQEENSVIKEKIALLKRESELLSSQLAFSDKEVNSQLESIKNIKHQNLVLNQKLEEITTQLKKSMEENQRVGEEHKNLTSSMININQAPTTIAQLQQSVQLKEQSIIKSHYFSKE